MREKKGLAPVIATILIILLTIILLLIVFLWARTWLGEKMQKFNADIEGACEEIGYDASISSTPSGYSLTIENKGNVAIYGFELRGTWEGDQKVSAYNIPVQAASSVVQEINLADFEGANGEPEKLEIYPLLLGNIKGKNTNRAYACLNQIQELSL